MAINQESNEYSVSRYTNFQWTITNADPNNLQFQITYGGGDEAKGIVRYIDSVLYLLEPSSKHLCIVWLFK